MSPACRKPNGRRDRGRDYRRMGFAESPDKAGAFLTSKHSLGSFSCLSRVKKRHRLCPPTASQTQEQFLDAVVSIMHKEKSKEKRM